MGKRGCLHMTSATKGGKMLTFTRIFYAGCWVLTIFCLNYIQLHNFLTLNFSTKGNLGLLTNDKSGWGGGGIGKIWLWLIKGGRGGLPPPYFGWRHMWTALNNLKIWGSNINITLDFLEPFWNLWRHFLCWMLCPIPWWNALCVTSCSAEGCRDYRRVLISLKLLHAQLE